jgi:enoyl-CoA hydratase/carnithine racemase
MSTLDRGIRYELDDHVARVTIDRPEVLNALDPAAKSRLYEVLGEIDADRRVRVVVVTGAGDRAFCVGDDMSADAIDQTGLEFWSSLDPNGFGGLSLRQSLDVPVIARVNGYAVGGGMEMVLGCDIIVAAEHAQLGLTEPRVGRIPLDGGVAQLVRRIPYTQAMGLLVTGRRVPAAQLHRMGLINDVVPHDRLDATVQGWVDDILACAPLSVRAIKQMVTRTAHLSAREAQAVRLPAVMEALDSEDSAEGVLAFQEKRVPHWRGV